MNVFEVQEQIIAQHLQEHLEGRDIQTRDISCLVCYPFPANVDFTTRFRNFWAWIRDYYQAEQCTNYTFTAFNVFLQKLNEEASPLTPQKASYVS